MRKEPVIVWEVGSRALWDAEARPASVGTLIKETEHFITFEYEPFPGDVRTTRRRKRTDSLAFFTEFTEAKDFVKVVQLRKLDRLRREIRASVRSFRIWAEALAEAGVISELPDIEIVSGPEHTLRDIAEEAS